MVLDLCVCDIFPRLDLPTRLIVLIHARENWRPSNTGHLARLALRNSKVVVRKDPIDYAHTATLVGDPKNAVVLFPRENAQALTPELVASLPRPLTLICPDGSWRQASKMVVRDPVLRALPRVFLPFSGRASVYRLRVETRPEGLATFEAIARALGAIEGAEVAERLEQAFRIYTDRALWARGRLSLAEAKASLAGTVFAESAKKS